MKTQKSSSLKKVSTPAASYKDRDLCSTNPLKEQFEPTSAMPVRQHYKMAGGA